MPLYRAAERKIIARLEIDLIKAAQQGHLGKRVRTSIAGELEMLLISAGVLVGQVEGRPKNAAELSRWLGIPAPTVQRKLAKLCQREICQRVDGRRYVMAQRKPGADYGYIDLALMLIRDAAVKSAALPR